MWNPQYLFIRQHCCSSFFLLSLSLPYYQEKYPIPSATVPAASITSIHCPAVIVPIVCRMIEAFGETLHFLWLPSLQNTPLQFVAPTYLCLCCQAISTTRPLWGREDITPGWAAIPRPNSAGERSHSKARPILLPQPFWGRKHPASLYFTVFFFLKHIKAVHNYCIELDDFGDTYAPVKPLPQSVP